METWRDIPGYEGRYMVSDDGRVRSLVTGVILRQALDADGYLLVSLTQPKRTAKVHHLVLSAFAEPRPPGAITRHLNGVRSDNRLHNLVWGTPQENADDRTRHGVTYVGRQNPNARLTPADVEAIRSHPRTRGYQLALAARFGVQQAAISKIVRGATWNKSE